jgi:hypothetical protein
MSRTASAANAGGIAAELRDWARDAIQPRLRWSC